MIQNIVTSHHYIVALILLTNEEQDLRWPLDIRDRRRSTLGQYGAVCQDTQRIKTNTSHVFGIRQIGESRAILRPDSIQIKNKQITFFVQEKQANKTSLVMPDKVLIAV